MKADKLKALVSKKSLGDPESSQRLFQMFYFERILKRISLSSYKGQIILKGGLLLSSIIGIDDRTTRDMDATLKGILVSEETILEIFKEILSIQLDDGVRFEIDNIKKIRQDDDSFQALKLEINNININLNYPNPPIRIEYIFNKIGKGQQTVISKNGKSRNKQYNLR